MWAHPARPGGRQAPSNSLQAIYDSDPDCRALVGVQLPTALRAPGLCPALEDLILGYLLSVRVRRNDDY
jgi:hypothetical protein